MNTHLEETLFYAAREMLDPAARESFLVQACGGDAALRARVEELFRAAPPSAVQPESEIRSVPEPVRPPPIEKAGDTIGRYRLLQQIGVGGCGAVYMAEQSEPVRRRVALKVIKLGMDTKSVIARFEAERQALAMMDHPNIARVLDGGATDTGRPYFVMELVRGIPITNYCDENNLPAPQRLDLFIAVCHAIQHAHQKGIIHRDIKPSNILVTLHDGVPVPKVIDFGIAKATEARLTDLTLFTELNAFIGTPAYTSPEQAEMSGLDIDTRADIYSLGVLLYELLAGRLPFDPKELIKAGIDEMRRTIREVEPPRPSTRLGTLTDAERTAIARQRGIDQGQLSTLLRGDLDWIVMKTLEKDRTRRYDTANGLAQDLQRYLTNEAVLARPPSAAYLLRKLARRHRTVFGACASVLLALITGIGISTWQAVRATRAERAIGEERTKAVTERDRARQAKKEADDQRKLAETARNGVESQLNSNRYATSMHLAQMAWEQMNIGRLREILEETRTYPNRGFEWYYWQRQTHLESKTLRGHKAKIESLAFSPNSQRIVTGSFDKTAKVWDAGTGRELLTLHGHENEVISVGFSLDGRRIVTVSTEQTKVWDAETGRELSKFNNLRDASSVAISPDGQRVVTNHRDGTAKVWDVIAGRELLTLKTGEEFLAFSLDGGRIVSTDPKVWDTGAESLIGESVDERSHKFPLAPSSDTGSNDKKDDFRKIATVWDGKTGKKLLIIKDHPGAASLMAISGGSSSVAISRNGQRLVTGDFETARVWDATTGHELFSLKGLSGDVFTVALSADSARIVTGSTDKTARVWDAKTGRELFTLRGEVSSVAISADGRRIVTGSDDGTAKVWDAGKGSEWVDLAGTNAIASVSFSPDGRQISSRVCSILPQSELRSMSVSSDAGRVVTVGKDGAANVWNAETGRGLLALKGHEGDLFSVAASHHGWRLVNVGHDGKARIWDADTGREILTLQGIIEGVSSIVFSSDARRIVTVDRDRTARIWNAETGSELLTLKGATGPVSSAAISQDARSIVTGSTDRMAKVWDAETGRELLTLEGHSEGISSVAFSPDGRRIVTGSLDGKIKVWDAGTGRELLTLRPRAKWGNTVSFINGYGGIPILSLTWYGPDNVWTTADFPGAYELAEKSSAADRDNADLQNELARNIITTDGIEYHGLEVAEKFAMRANAAAKGKSPNILDTLARVLFMQNRTEAAIQLQEQAVKLANNEEKSGLQETLGSYRKGVLPEPD